MNYKKEYNTKGYFIMENIFDLNEINLILDIISKVNTELYPNTKSLNGEIMDELLDVKNIIFCFGTAIPETTIAAVRPRSISVCELNNKFVIEFMEVPKEELNLVIESWTNSLLIK